MLPTEILKDEHRVIEQVLNCLERLADQCAAGQKLDRMTALKALDFFRTFADGCHHRKEEAHLFPALEAKGFPSESGPTAVMRSEHVEGRQHIQAMALVVEQASFGNSDAIEKFIEHAHAYVQLLREHIAKEDNCLFPMADRVLSPNERDALLGSFAELESGQEANDHERCLEIADQLARRFGLAQGALASSCVCGHHSH